MGLALDIIQYFCDKKKQIETWFQEQWDQSPPLFYGSVDLRYAGYKLAPVDTNLFPAGFNNLGCEVKPVCIQAVQSFIQRYYPTAQTILVIPENHTRNCFYFKNLMTLIEILAQAGLQPRIGSLRPDLIQVKAIKFSSKQKLSLEPLLREGQRLGVVECFPDLILLNNDLSEGIPEILRDIAQPITPSLQLGWATRLKSQHFTQYQKVVQAFSQHIAMDPWTLLPDFFATTAVDFLSGIGMSELELQSEKLLQQIAQRYQERGITETPFVVIKADAGTYGMAVMMIRDAQDLRRLNRKQRSRMAASKGGSSVSQVIVQEGVYSHETIGDIPMVAEPVLYSMGSQIVGGFYRMHPTRSSTENLNTPGMQFQAFSQANPTLSQNQYAAYAIVARLAMLAASREREALCE